MESMEIIPGRSDPALPLAPCSLLGFEDPTSGIQGSNVIGSSSHQLFDSSVVERSAAEAAAYKSGRGFPQETLQAVRVGPRMVLKNNDNDKVLLILFKGVPP